MNRDGFKDTSWLKPEKPRVSIGMPIFNAEKYLQDALNALLSQTFSDFELIISDNASTDATEAICQEYASKDSRVKYYRNETNLGAAQNFRRVFERSVGEYFKWASHDDIHAPEYLERCVEVLDNQASVVLCYPQSNEIDSEGNVTRIYTQNLNICSSKPHERLYQLLETYGWYHATQAYGLMRASELKKTRLLGNYPHADRVLLAELSLLGKFYEVPEFLFNRRVHPQVAQIANPTNESLAVWFDSNNKGKILLPRWRRYFEYCTAVQRAGFSGDEQLGCYLQILRRLFLSKGLTTRLRGISEELVKATVQLVLAIRQKPRRNSV